MRKPAFCICENKDADQLRGKREADQRLCFRYTDSSIPLLPNFKPLAIFCGFTAWFVSDLVGNLEDRFSQNEAHFMFMFLGQFSGDLVRQSELRQSKINSGDYLQSYSFIQVRFEAMINITGHTHGAK